LTQSSANSALAPTLRNSRLARFEVLEKLGQGSTGVVFRAFDPESQQTLALKVLRPVLNGDHDRRSRFLREARTVKALAHPHIATIYEVGEALLEPGLCAELEPEKGANEVSCLYLAFELVEGEDLRSLLDRGPLTLEQSLDLSLQILSALQAAHRVGVIHRDLKPANVRIGPGFEAKLIDFGFAKILPPANGDPITGSNLTLDGMVMGTLPYIAPEQVQGMKVDARADLFALGVMLYEMTTGCVPFPGSSLLEYARSLLGHKLVPPSRLVPTLPPFFDQIVAQLLALDPNDRLMSAPAVEKAITRCYQSHRERREAPIASQDAESGTARERGFWSRLFKTSRTD
jgi:eukaryotic-like serine/threonine-protein kinase